MNASDIAQTLADKGQPMTLSRETVGVFDPITSSTTGAVVQTWPVYGITSNYRLSDAMASNSLILTGDKIAIIGATVPPLVGDGLAIMGTGWKIISFDEVSPQGEALMYKCQVRK